MTNRSNPSITYIPEDLATKSPDITALVTDFVESCFPLEKAGLTVLQDARTNARYTECHIKASTLVDLATVDVPLDPEEQPDYRANREIVEDAEAYQTMKDDAKQRRSFSNIVVEFARDFDPDHPIKIIGGQHRFGAIAEALETVDEFHGLKVYFGLDFEPASRRAAHLEHQHRGLFRPLRQNAGDTCWT